MGARAAEVDDRRIHAGSASLVGRHLRFIGSRPRSKDWCSSPSAIRGRKTRRPLLARRRPPSTHDTRDRLGQIEVPCLVLVGELDLLNPPRVASRAKRNDCGMRPLVVLPGVGHMPHVEDQTRFRQEIDRFLDQGNA